MMFCATPGQIHKKKKKKKHFYFSCDRDMATAETCKTKSTTKSIGRRNVVPVIHVRGTHYEIGFDIVRIR